MSKGERKKNKENGVQDRDMYIWGGDEAKWPSASGEQQEESGVW